MYFPSNWEWQLEQQRDEGNDWFYCDDELKVDFYNDPIESGCYYVINDDWIPELMLIDYVDTYINDSDQGLTDISSALEYLDDNGIDYFEEII